MTDTSTSPAKRNCDGQPSLAPATLLERINDYLQNGGLFNPEMMEHDKVRDLLLDCRETLSTDIFCKCESKTCETKSGENSQSEKPV